MQFGDKEKSDSLQETLIEIIEICKENNINLKGVKFPVTAAYQQVIKERSYKADSVLKEHGVEVLDFKNWRLGEDDLFKDQDHLTLDGGQVLAKELFQNGD